MELNALITKRKASMEALNSLVQSATKENRDLTADETTKFDALTAEAERLGATIDRLRKLEGLNGRQAQVDPPTTPPPGPAKDTVQARDTIDSLNIGHVRDFKSRVYKDNRVAFAIGRAMQAGLFMNHQSHKIRKASADARQWCEDRGIEYEAVMSGVNNATGGAMVFEEFSNRVVDLAQQFGVFRQRAERVPMNSDKITWPIVTSGLTAYYVGESTEITASDVGTANATLVAKKLATLTRIPNELIADSAVSIADLITRKAALALATAEDDAGFEGDGTSTYGGIQGVYPKQHDGSHTAGVYTGITGNTAFSTLDIDDFESMIGKLPEFPGISPAWYISKPAWAASMLRLQMVAGGNVVADIAGGGTMQFLGYPVVWTQRTNSTLTAQTSTVAQVGFGDLAMAAAFGDRQMMQMEADASRYFELDQTAVRTIQRYDVNCHSLGDNTNAGPWVSLIFPGS